MSDTLELTDRQRKRLESIKAECSDPHIPEPTDSAMVSSLLDTWDAVNDGYYSGYDGKALRVAIGNYELIIGVGKDE